MKTVSTCKECSREYIYDRSKGHNKTKCNSCVVNKRRFDLKAKAVDYKGGACIVCGYNKCHRALIFHHLIEDNKEFGISGSHALSWEKIKKELDKCALLCSNCHMEVHDGLIKLSMGQ